MEEQMLEQFLGIVRDGAFEMLWPDYAPAGAVRLTTVQMGKGHDPESAELDLSKLEGQAIMIAVAAVALLIFIQKAMLPPAHPSNRVQPPSAWDSMPPICSEAALPATGAACVLKLVVPRRMKSCPRSTAPGPYFPRSASTASARRRRASCCRTDASRASCARKRPS